MASLKKRLAAIARRISNVRGRLAAARKRVRKLTVKINRLEVSYQSAIGRAEQARRAGNSRQVRAWEKHAHNLAARIGTMRGKRRYWIGKVKRLLNLKESLADSRAATKKQIAKLEKQGKISIDVTRNKVTGGTPGDRFRAACLTSSDRCLSGKRRNFYSQPGSWTVKKSFTGETPGERSDCSQWLTGICWTAGLPDPNGTKFGWGYTGTLVGQHNGWKLVSESRMREKGWGFVVYGSGTGHHVEAYVGPGDKTIGHGSAAIDPGVINLFRDGNYRCYIYES